MPLGRMSVRRDARALPGHEGYGTLSIEYSFKDGVQGPEHPQPGQPYYGDYRSAYLPASPQGYKILKMLELAWDRRLMFSLGYSITRNCDGVIIWNGIHMKTSRSGGSSRYGYPDPTYLDRVTEELKVKGCTLPEGGDDIDYVAMALRVEDEPDAGDESSNEDDRDGDANGDACGRDRSRKGQDRKLDESERDSESDSDTSLSLFD